MLADTIAILAQAKEQTTDTILWIIAAGLTERTKGTTVAAARRAAATSRLG